MSIRRFAVATSAMTCLCTTAATADSMRGNEIRAMLAGKTIYVSAPFGSLPIRYSAGGTMVAKSRAMGVYAGVSEDRGTWRIRGNGLCQRWKTWNKGKEQCFTLVRNGKKISFRSKDGVSGTAVASN